ncbi:hypothetical protein AAG570_012829 [Ranatra chinensis]|uniref:Uncharacterized protein n=1 Tax=Ranatra chinensis TaxID=642074 RepID=A0ABD0YEZ5_9HEMI
MDTIVKEPGFNIQNSRHFVDKLFTSTTTFITMALSSPDIKEGIGMAEGKFDGAGTVRPKVGGSSATTLGGRRPKRANSLYRTREESRRSHPGPKRRATVLPGITDSVKKKEANISDYTIQSIIIRGE